MTDIDISHISGNAPDEVKRFVGNMDTFFANRPDITGPTFGELIMNKLVVTEISVHKKLEEPEKLEGRFICEITVGEDMVNGGGNIHGGCSAYLIDICSTLALAALNMTTTGEPYNSVSQSLNVVYHSPAGVGDKIRLVNITMTLGARAQTVRTEIWNVTHHRLVSSGVHIKMQPSPSTKANL